MSDHINISRITQPVTAEGNDAADWQSNPTAVQEFMRSVSEAGIPEAFDLGKFALNGSASEMESKMLDDKYILGRLAILGQSTVIYAPPNTGKTLLVLWLMIQSIKSGEIAPGDMFYINADDNHKGLTYKLKLAEKYGFLMLAPGYNDFKAESLSHYLQTLIEQDTASGKVLILDTVKKFTNIMRKDRASEFGEAMRQFVSHGGSVVMLAHVNKHRGDDGKVIYAGTSDLVDDADCAYTLDAITEDNGTRTVSFENFKSRGDVAAEEVYSYNHGEGVSYQSRLDSIRAVTTEERAKAEKRRKRDEALERNQDAVAAIRECLRDGVVSKTELVKEAGSRSGISKQKIRRALDDHTGTDYLQHQYWHVDVQNKNAHVYRLNFGA